MKDILGRELKDGDLCIGMAIGRNSSGMHIGVFQGSSVVRLSGSETLHKSCTSNTYLIENPTKEEVVIKNKILKLLEEEAASRERKSKLKTIPLSKLEVGGIYKSTNDDYYLYLGKRKVTFKNLMRRTEETQEGQCFLDVWNADLSPDDIISVDRMVNTWRTEHRITVLKGNKKLTELVRKIDLTFPLVKKVNKDTRYEHLNLELIVE